MPQTVDKPTAKPSPAVRPETTRRLLWRVSLEGFPSFARPRVDTIEAATADAAKQAFMRRHGITDPGTNKFQVEPAAQAG